MPLLWKEETEDGLCAEPGTELAPYVLSRFSCVRLFVTPWTVVVYNVSDFVPRRNLIKNTTHQPQILRTTLLLSYVSGDLSVTTPALT